MKSDDVRVTAMPITHVDERIACQHFRDGDRGGRYPISRGSRVVVGLQAMNEATPLLSGTLDLLADRGGLDPQVHVDEEENTVTRTVSPDRAGAFSWRLAGERPKELVFDIYEPDAVGVLVASREDDHTVSIRPAVNGVPTCVYGGTAARSRA